jgi:hypothetical protein
MFLHFRVPSFGLPAVRAVSLLFVVVDGRDVKQVFVSVRVMVDPPTIPVRTEICDTP